MSFELAAIIVVSLGAVVLALICYHLLGRLEQLERAVQGGLEPPSSRLSREQFERRFKIAHARSGLAAQIGTGLVVILGQEASTDHDLVRTLANTSRVDLISLGIAPGPTTREALGLSRFAGLDIGSDLDVIGVTTTPYAFVIDDGQVRQARPIASGAHLVELLEQATS